MPGPSPVQPIVYSGRPLRLPREGSPSVWLRVRGSHDVQSSPSTDAHQQDGYPDATDSRCPLSTNSTLQPCFCPKVKPRLHLILTNIIASDRMEIVQGAAGNYDQKDVVLVTHSANGS